MSDPADTPAEPVTATSAEGSTTAQPEANTADVAPVAEWSIADDDADLADVLRLLAAQDDSR